jgi:hypothetical protein
MKLRTVGIAFALGGPGMVRYEKAFAELKAASGGVMCAHEEDACKACMAQAPRVDGG